MAGFAPSSWLTDDDTRRWLGGDSSTERSLAVAAGTVVGLAVVIALVIVASPGPDTAALSDVGLVMGTAGTLAAVALVAVAAGRTLLVGDPGSRWVGAAALTYGTLSLALPHVLGPFLGSSNGLIDAIDEAGQTVALALFLVGAFLPDTRFLGRPAEMLRAAAVAVAALTTVYLLSPGLGAALALDRVGSARQLGTLLTVAAVAAWMTVAGRLAVGSVRDAGQGSWCVLLVLALTLGRLAEAVAGTPDGAWAAGLTLQGAGLLAAAILAARELARAFLEEWEPDARDEPPAALGPPAAGTVLELANGSSPPDPALAPTAVPRAGHPVAATDPPGGLPAAPAGVDEPGLPVEAVRLAEVAETVVNDLDLTASVPVDIPAEMVAAGSPARAAAVVRLLLDNARQRSPGGGIRVRGVLDGPWATIRVDDDGPALSFEARRALSAGFDLPGGDGAASSVLAARRLVRVDGGDLWVELGEGGGCTFAVCLPAALPTPVDSSH